MTTIVRQGTPADSYAAYAVFLASITDLSRRSGSAPNAPVIDAQAVADQWPRYRAIFDHLAAHCEHFWIAEEDGEAIAYARSILRGSVRELTELFVLPGRQAGGIGRELLARAFPSDGAANRCILATMDSRALVRYLKTGVSAQLSVHAYTRRPEVVPLPPVGLSIMPLTDSPELLEQLGAVDETVLGFRRDPEHGLFLRSRTGFAAVRDDTIIGYGYVGERSGPFAAASPADLPVVLAHAETLAAQHGHESLTVRVPMSNRVAIQYLLGRGFEIDKSFGLLLSDHRFGQFDRYCITNPAFVL